LTYYFGVLFDICGIDGLQVPSPCLVLYVVLMTEMALIIILSPTVLQG